MRVSILLSSLLAVACVALSGCSGGGSPASGQYAVKDLGNLGGEMYVTAISPSGRTTGYGLVGGSAHAFLYQDKTLYDLATLAGESTSRGNTLSDSGLVAGGSLGTPSKGISVLNRQMPQEAVGLPGGDTTVFGCDAAGNLVGRSKAADGSFHGFYRAGGTLLDLGAGAAYATNGSLVVGVGATGRAAVLGGSAGAPRELDASGSQSSVAYAVNASGVAVGTRTVGGVTHAARFAEGAVADLGTLSGDVASEALAISDAGKAVGYSQDGVGKKRAVAFTGGSVVDLNGQLNGSDQAAFHLTDATGINTRGQICCNTSEGKAVILEPVDGTIVVPTGRYELVDLDVLHAPGLTATCSMTPIQNTSTGKQDFTGHVYPGIGSPGTGSATPNPGVMTVSGNILFVGAILGPKPGAPEQLTVPYYLTDVFNYITPGKTGLNPFSNPVAYVRTFVYTNGTFKDLGVPGGINKYAGTYQTNTEPGPYLSFHGRIVSPNGQYVYGSSNYDAIQHFQEFLDYYAQVQSAVGTRALVYGNGGFSGQTGDETVVAVNDSGKTCGSVGAQASIGGQAIGPGACSAINNRGDVAGASGMAFLYSGARLIEIDLGGRAGASYAINENAEVVGESKTADGQTHAFLYSNGKTSDLGLLPGGTYSSARYINEAGEIVGYANNAAGKQVPVLFKDGKAIDLNELLSDTDRAKGPFTTVGGLDQDGNMLLIKNPNLTESYVFLMKPVR